MIYALWQRQGMLYIYRNSGVLEQKQELIAFLSAWCLSRGSTLKGRRDAACQLLACRQKVPIIISDRSEDILFPLYAMTAAEPLWVNARAIKKLYPQPQGACFCFENGFELSVPISVHTARRGLRLARRLSRLLEEKARFS